MASTINIPEGVGSAGRLGDKLKRSQAEPGSGNRRPRPEDAAEQREGEGEGLRSVKTGITKTIIPELWRVPFHIQRLRQSILQRLRQSILQRPRHHDREMGKDGPSPVRTMITGQLPPKKREARTTNLSGKVARGGA
ncbi:hypothetical protein SAMN00790413_06255 [Deinococcus hopiensis KR-140]|uniref:Uncharacterized protein n=1 Tax=Deinococcus hopiensis KR-140 TaxID=695939 RepID=A0A1W1VUM9_9DEIO|nr:hypothetical protein SAMN00790413_06255 [Deinococcus hopiensis KR-140]